MTIYQVINEQNYPVDEYEDLDVAEREAELRNTWHEDHYFYVGVAEVESE